MIRALYPEPRCDDDAPAGVLLECDVCRFTHRTSASVEGLFEGRSDWHRLHLPNRARAFPGFSEVHFCSACWPGNVRALKRREARAIHEAAALITGHPDYDVESAAELVRCDLLSIISQRGEDR